MNNKGKIGAILVFLIPLFIVISIIIFDTLYSYISEDKLKKDTENIIKEVVKDDNLFYDEYPEKIKRLYEKKGYNTDMLVIDCNSYEINISQEYYYFGLISSLKGSLGEEQVINIFGMHFKIYKNNKTIINVNAKYDDNNIEFDYTK